MIPKFRAWVKPDILSNHLNGVIAEALPNFIYGNCLVLREDLEEDKQFEEIIDFLDIELMQSTGLKDKNGVEIFEGDIVQWGDTPDWEEEPIRVAVVKINPDIQFDSNVGIFEYGQFAYRDTERFLTVLGNIYENSELLEEQR